MKKNSKKRRWLVAIALILLLGISYIGIQQITAKEQQSVKLHPTKFMDLSLPDGQYQGDFKQAVVAVKVNLTLRDKRVTAIDLIEHTTGLGTKAETIIDKVIQQQNTDIELVSGATLSSKVILKAIEKALLP